MLFPAADQAPPPPLSANYHPTPYFPRAARRRVLLVLLVLFGGGVLAHVWPALRAFSLAITTPLLLLTNALVLLAVLDDERARRLRWWCLAAWVVTVALEMIGVATGRIFGPYHYGSTLRGQLAGVPLLIGLNWVTLLLGALALAARVWPAQWAFRTVSAALLLTAFDWVMEPVAVHLGYWQWHTWPLIPAQNYVAWFAIALGLGGAFAALGLRIRTTLAAAYFGVQLGFFVLLRVVMYFLN